MAGRQAPGIQNGAVSGNLPAGAPQNQGAQPYGQPTNRGHNTSTVNTINGPTTATGLSNQDRGGPAGSGPYGNTNTANTTTAQPVAGQPLGAAGAARPSRRDQLGSGPPGGALGTQNSSIPQPTSARGSPASLRGRGGSGRGRGDSRSYNTSPSGFLEPRGPGAGVDEYGHRHVPQSISSSAFTVGGVSGDPAMDRMDRTMDRMGDPGMGPGMGRMDRGGMGGMSGPMDRTGMGGGMGGMGGMDHHRSSSMGPPPMHGRSRSASRGIGPAGRGPGYHSLDRDGYGDREFLPIREPRERSLDRDFVGGGSYGGGMGTSGRMGLDGRMDPAFGGGVGTSGLGGSGAYGRRERSLDRRDMLDPHLDDGLGYNRDIGLRSGDPMLRGDPSVPGRLGGLGPGRTGLSPNPIGLTGRDHAGRDAYFSELHTTNSDLQRDLANLKKELELTNQKLGSSMHSIKTFWSPELKKERALRKEESAKYSLINDQLKLLNSENQVSFSHSNDFSLILFP